MPRARARATAAIGWAAAVGVGMVMARQAERADGKGFATQSPLIRELLN
jgi:hypothetical protein